MPHIAVGKVKNCQEKAVEAVWNNNDFDWLTDLKDFLWSNDRVDTVYFNTNERLPSGGETQQGKDRFIIKCKQIFRPTNAAKSTLFTRK